MPIHNVVTPQPDSIFVSIASYRDPELIPTLRDMIAHAANPAALHIAICCQHDSDVSPFIDFGMKLLHTEKIESYDVSFFEYRDARISVISLHYYESKGACWARHMAERLYRNEAWFLQIDSHCRFAPDWDREAIAMLRELQADGTSPVLSTYPPAYDPEDESKRTQFISRLVFREFSADGIPMLSSTPLKSDKPARCGYLAGGFIFAPGSFVRDVPNDPDIFFAGEEIAMAARAFTHGYDIYTPNKILLWHYYQRSDASKIWSDHTNDAKKTGSVDLAWWERDKISKKRVRSVLGIDASPYDLGCYGHGDIRTLADFEQRLGVHFLSQTVMPDVIGRERVSYFPGESFSKEMWLTQRVHPNKRKITFTIDEIMADIDNDGWWHIGVYSENNTLLEKKTFTPQEMAQRFSDKKNVYEIELTFTTPPSLKPAVVRVCSYTQRQGWGKTVEKMW
ncbi:GlcNAc-transferase family protein [Siccibacter colletis]|uniref:GlcNAc-transferase family protein n=1 Tax=Siccibacter colletis TaxID=1505757 RepID=UPI00068B1789|nr:GlcNAc-transferase family protein [Siccibacter colletis]